MPELDIRGILAELVREDVEFLVIGGVAARIERADDFESGELPDPPEDLMDLERLRQARGEQPTQ